MKDWFQRKNIFIKLMLIGGSSLLLIVLPSFFAMTFFLSKAERAARIQTMTDGIIIEILDARVAEKNFILHDLQDGKFYETGLSDNLRAHQRLTENAYQKIKQLIEGRSTAYGSDIARLMHLLRASNKIFIELVATYRKIGFKDWGLLGQWRRAIHDVEHRIIRLKRTDMQQTLLQLRRREKDYLLRGDRQYLVEVQNRITELRQELPKIADPAATKISADLTIYENALQDFVALQKKVGRTDKEGLHGQFSRMIDKMESVVAQIMAQSKSDYQQAKFDFRLMSLSICLFGMAVGITFYYFFARSVSTKLIELKNGVLRVGRGHLDTSVPATTKDEIGIVAEAFNKMTGDLKQITVSKNYVDKIIEAMADMLIVTDVERKIEMVNRAALNLLKYEEEELGGRKVNVIWGDPNAADFFIEKIIRTASLQHFETELVCKDRRKISVSLSGSPMPGNGGFVFLAQDNTERKRAEKMLRKSENELRLLSSRILDAQEIERKRVARELHDGIGQALTGIKFSLENGIRRLKETGTMSDFKTLDDIVPLIQATVEETRRISMGLRPSTLDDIGISETIYWFCRQFEAIYKNIRILQSIEVEEEQIPETLKTVIFRVLQESLNNAAKHSGADRIQVSLQQEDNSVKLTVEDNGVGFDPDHFHPSNANEQGFGLAGMHERIELSGGNLTIEAAPGEATRICAVWPLER